MQPARLVAQNIDTRAYRMMRLNMVIGLLHDQTDGHD